MKNMFFLLVLLSLALGQSTSAAVPKFASVVIKDKDVVITTQVLEDLWFDLASEGADTYVKKLEETRGAVNFFAGISDWVVKKHSVESGAGRSTLHLQGEFTHAKATTYFYETQVFIKPNIYQMKLSSTNFADVNEKAAQKAFAPFLAELR
jgi:hypothetical protein